MPPPIPRCSNWAYSSLNSPSCFSLPRYGSRVGLHIFLFEACSTFTRVAACTLALSPIRDTLIEGFSHFVTSMTAPIASGWSSCRVGLPPTGKRRLVTAHTHNGHRPASHVAAAKPVSTPIKVLVRPATMQCPGTFGGGHEPARVYHAGWRRSGGFGEYSTIDAVLNMACLLYTSPSPRDGLLSRMPS